jgi:hypothetical protein
MPDFVFHDLRRTFRTSLGRLGVRSEVAELAIGHTLPSLESVYNVYDYLEERRDACARMGKYIAGIVGDQSNVVQMPFAATA